MKKILMVIMLICSINVFSQADDPADGDGTVPVDGGLSLLLAAGGRLCGAEALPKGRKVRIRPVPPACIFQ
jgi:hypothetical protein